ncbi:MAG: DUF3137 domain-containing protein [Gemmatimonadetes bacterium]|nr:DUF3137 domain-containing protein [Gemmatimonadota bacterium]
MSIRRSIFGPSKDEIWRQIASDIEGEFVDGGFWGENAVTYNHGEWRIVLDTRTESTYSGTMMMTVQYTRMRAPFVNKDGLYFDISLEGFLSSIGRLFGMRDIVIGDRFFDDRFLIKGNSPKKIRLLLADERIRELFQKQPKVQLRIKDDEGIFGADFPDGVDELHFECAGVIKEAEALKDLFELFCRILERLVQIDSAYEDDPKVRLK